VLLIQVMLLLRVCVRRPADTLNCHRFRQGCSNHPFLRQGLASFRQCYLPKLFKVSGLNMTQSWSWIWNGVKKGAACTISARPFLKVSAHAATVIMHLSFVQKFARGIQDTLALLKVKAGPERRLHLVATSRSSHRRYG